METSRVSRRSVMLNRVKLTDAEMKEFAEVFAYYDYGDDEIGMVPYC